MSAFARVDYHADPAYTTNSYWQFRTDGKPVFIIGGLDFEAGPNVHVMPNVEVATYREDDAGAKPDADVIPRVTLFWKFR